MQNTLKVSVTEIQDVEEAFPHFPYCIDTIPAPIR